MNVRRLIPIAALIMLLGGIYWFIPPVWKLADDGFVVNLNDENQFGKTVAVGPQKTGWTPLTAVSKHLLDAIIVAEDARFYQHHGLDFTEIKNSFDQNIKQGRIARGGSTLTQQVVKMAFLTREKSFIRKAREATGALIVECLLEKDEILEWYVNLAEFGSEVYGIAAAANQYFQIKPRQITMQQAIHLALVLPNPKVWSTGLRKKALTDFGHKRFSQIVGNLKLGNFITEDERIDLLASGNFGAPVKGYLVDFPQYFEPDDASNDSEEGVLFPEEYHPQENGELDSGNGSFIVEDASIDSEAATSLPHDPPNESEQTIVPGN